MASPAHILTLSAKSGIEEGEFVNSDPTMVMFELSKLPTGEWLLSLSKKEWKVLTETENSILFEKLEP